MRSCSLRSRRRKKRTHSRTRASWPCAATVPCRPSASSPRPFETCGVADRDCELKFHMCTHAFSIDIAKTEQPRAQQLYRVLQELSRAQADNARLWDVAKSALDASVRCPGRVADANTLVAQAMSVQIWLHESFLATNPHCYLAVI